MEIVNNHAFVMKPFTETPKLQALGRAQVGESNYATGG